VTLDEPDAGGVPGRILVVGAGLIGTSLGLAAGRAGAEVSFHDRDGDRARRAVGLGAGSAVLEQLPQRAAGFDLVVVATPPRAIAPVATSLLRSEVGPIVTHVGSVQAQPQREIEANQVSMARFVGGHPVAGRELSGPEAADADLFRERPWVLCPTADTDPVAVRVVTALARACGARPVHMSAPAHDELFARLSHLPQLVASALAASLSAVEPADVALAGAGMRDTTRLADSDPLLWAQIVAANAPSVARALRGVAEPLVALAGLLERGGDDEAAAAVGALVEAGRAGRSLLPGKHGGVAAALATLQVDVPDEPGALARLLDTVAAEGVNLEDLRVEHAPGRPLGLAELVVAPDALHDLAETLRGGGWTVRAAGGTAL
jgi:prephenate dehydrogenase